MDTGGIIALQHTLHNITATQLLEQLGQTLAHHLLNLIVLVVLLILVLPTVLLSAMLLPTMLLSVVLSTMLPRVSAAAILRMLGRRGHLVYGTALEIYVDAAFVLLGLVLQSKLTADLFDSGFDLLDVVATVISLAYNDMQVSLAPTSCGLDALFKHILGFLNEQPVQINSVVLDTAIGVVFAENVVARLTIIFLHFRSVLLSFLGQLVGACAVARFVGLVSAVEAGATFCCLLAREVTKAIVFCFGIVVGVIKRWNPLARCAIGEGAVGRAYSASPLIAFPWRP